MVTHINQIGISQGTSLADISRAFGQDDAKLYAKKTDDGVVLYSKTGSSFLDKILLVKGPDNTLMSKANAKKMLARDTVANIVQTAIGRTTTNVTRGQSGLQGDSVGYLGTKLLDNIRDRTLLSDDHVVTGAMAGKIANSVDRLLTRLEGMKTDKGHALPQERLPVPDTGTREIPGHEVDLGRLKAPALEIGGQRFDPVRVLGQATNIVVLYRQHGEVEGEPRTLAVKLPNTFSPNYDARVEEQTMIKEYNTAKAFVGDSPHVAGFNDIVKLADGRVALIGPTLPNGDFEALTDNLTERTLPRDHTGEVPPGKITAEERDLIVATMMQDALKGLGSIHEGRTGGVHRDVKPQNFMVDSEGKGRVVDFGESVTSRSYSPALTKIIENPRYVSPEVLKGQDDVPNLTKERQIMVRSDLEQVMTDTAVALFGENEKIGEVVGSLVEWFRADINEAGKGSLRDVTLGPGMDIWGAGATAYQMVTGRMLTESFENKDRMGIVVQDRLKALPNQFDRMLSVGSEPRDERTVLNGTGSAPLDRLLNRMLALDPNQRPDARTLLDDPVFADVKVGSEQVRELILAIKSGDGERIAQAREGLALPRTEGGETGGGGGNSNMESID